MITCPSCGFQLPDDAKFCSQCGMRLSQVESTMVMPTLDDQTLTDELSTEDIHALESLPTGSALLIVEKGPGTGQRFLLQDDQDIAGRHPKSDIFLDDVTVSRKHAVFTRDQGSFAVEDAGSLNGTYVNRILLREPVLLRNGDEVQIGKFKMVFFLGSAGVE
ncbi:MAG: FHA domain-containing protein [Propionibacteriaceae bacterium]|jgi:pSer/pThr/pTyr-binding forkhead associated (FHA) protein|nr:FHA domain-containing protein [Propionibacteriaceae bacterium]